jgi:hypothetical protein
VLLHAIIGADPDITPGGEAFGGVGFHEQCSYYYFGWRARRF